ncbi:FAD-dependent oxidoreductase [Pseudomonas sp. KB_12]|uniref:FAD-dependent oxidoreductase n=1 Tax=Pseudomonas sp. KB_12 TaxID=3233034 RepID=UPI003F9A88AC
MKPQRIAIVGGGTAGATLAWHLAALHQVTLFEAGEQLGGHAFTHTLIHDGKLIHADMGVEYFTERLAPNLMAHLKALDVDTFVAPLSFSCLDADASVLWSNQHTGKASSPALRQAFDRFHQDMVEVSLHQERYKSWSVGDFVRERGYDSSFVHQALLPLLTVYSGCNGPSLDYSLVYCAVSFNMNLLSFFSPAYWRKATGGIDGYLKIMHRVLGPQVRLNTPVTAVRPHERGVEVSTLAGSQDFDQVVLATHADQALRLLETPTPEQTTLLGAYEYVPVEAILHSDSAAVAHGSPDSYCVFVKAADAPGEANHAWGTLTRVVTYFEPSSTPLYVTFDPKMALDPSKVILRKQWKLPKLRPLDLHRRSLIRAIQGRERIWYCGTDFSYGGHEGALTSGLVLAQRFGASVDQGSNASARIQFELVKDLMGVESASGKLIRQLDQRLLRIAEKLGAVERLAPRVMRHYLQ